jgi:CheY-like chemotaxis protein
MQLAGSDQQAVGEVRAVMERQLQHLVRLVDDLLDVSRISRGRLELRKERITLADVIDSALETCTAEIEQRNQRLTVSLPDAPLHVDADKTRLVQVLCNLLSNAAKYSEPGSPIRLAVERDGDEAVIRVQDEGIGIAPHLLPHVFEMFTQLDQSLERSQSGMGVGLAIARQLIEMHGGSVQAHSEGLESGSEFIVRLPLLHSPATAQQGTEGDGPSSGPAAVYRILVVDDNRDAAQTLATMLKLMGHEVHTAHDGYEGVEAATAFQPDVILLDIGMPRLNGFDACQRIREQPWSRNVLIVALTGWGQEQDKLRSQQVGFNKHLVKPVEPAALTKLLADAGERGT